MGGMMIILLTFIPLVSGARLLLVPLYTNSHVGYFLNAGSELLKKGHIIDMILPENIPFQHDMPKNNFTVIKWPVTTTASTYFIEKITKDEDIGLHMLRTKFTTHAMARYFESELKIMCAEALSDDVFFRKLQNQKYDMAIMDGIDLVRCMYVLPYKLGIPFVTLMSLYEPWLYRLPALFSFVPFGMEVPFTEKMTFYEKMHNLFTTIDVYIWHKSITTEDFWITTYASEKPSISMRDLARQSLLWFINTDPVIDYARPTMPHVINVGGLTAEPGKNLSEEIKTFLDGATSGAIIVSFGSVRQVLPSEVYKKLFKAFSVINQRIIFKYLGKPIYDLPSHIKLLPWIPQNDILAHPNIKLFITHGGNNGQFEALYHGIPMMVGPIFSEQKYNGNRIVYKGFGKMISLKDFTPDELVEMINEIIGNPEYERKIKHGSAVFRSAPESPRERLVYWVEHVLKFGGEHLRSVAIDMPWYEYWMLDILVFLFGIGVIFSLVTFQLVKLACRRICLKAGYKNKQE